MMKTIGVSPSAMPGGQAERVVDRRADVAVGGREQRRRAEDALEAVMLSAPPGHDGEAYAPYRNSWYGTDERITCRSNRRTRLM